MSKPIGTVITDLRIYESKEYILAHYTYQLTALNGQPDAREVKLKRAFDLENFIEAALIFAGEDQIIECSGFRFPPVLHVIHALSHAVVFRGVVLPWYYPPRNDSPKNDCVGGYHETCTPLIR